ncbi:MAG: pyrimidine 5'-nucleotidase [Rhizobiaceae bacterium]|nr:pyrimidine 5'-nucleotidase [Rhizobiaceae bacterium]
MEHFKTIDTWVFDLDNTLYPRHCDLFSQIDVLMTGYVSNLTGLERTEARKLQKDLYRDYGTTLRGLMETHGIDPHDFLGEVHNIDYSPLPKNPKLAEMLSALPGRKLIYTNGSVKHAQDTLEAMDVDHSIFESIFDIVASDFEPKPHPEPFAKFLADHNVNASSAAMFEDLPRNLEPAKANGMMTVLITPQQSANYVVEAWEHVEANEPYIDHQTDDLDGFLENVLKIV